jgi:hypothetical protein
LALINGIFSRSAALPFGFQLLTLLIVASDLVPGYDNWQLLMRRKVSAAFLFVAIVSGVVWIVGLVAGVVIPVFGGLRAEKLGEICFMIAMTAELFLYFFGWLFQEKERREFRGFSGDRDSKR